MNGKTILLGLALMLVCALVPELTCMPPRPLGRAGPVARPTDITVISRFQKLPPNPNGGTTVGLLPVFLVYRMRNSQIRRIVAVDLTHNKHARRRRWKYGSWSYSFGRRAVVCHCEWAEKMPAVCGYSVFCGSHTPKRCQLMLALSTTRSNGSFLWIGESLQ